MPKYYISSPVENMRAAADQKSEVISQAFFSEEITLLEDRGEWAHIATTVDQYQGWIKQKGICRREKNYPTSEIGSHSSVKIKRCSAHLYGYPDTIFGPILTLPFESRLELHQEIDQRWLKVATPDNQVGFVQRGDVEIKDGSEFSTYNTQQMCELSHFFLGLPYTWGGRSSFGYDCSGFVQMLYRQCGIFLPRDSKDQCSWSGFIETPFDSLKAGDLIFFGYDHDKIRHVGLFLSQDQFIHAAAVVENAPYIRLSRLVDSAWNGTGYYNYRTARTFR